MPPSSSKKWPWFLLAFLLMFFLFIGMIPTILSTHSGTAWLLNRIGKKIDMQVSATDLSLSWGKGQSATGLKIKDRENLLLECPEVHCTESLLHILFLKSFGTCTILKPHAEVRGPLPSNISKVPIPWQHAGIAPLTVGFSLTDNHFSGIFLVTEGHVDVFPSDMQVIAFQNITSRLEMPSAAFTLTCQTQHGGETGKIDIQGHISDLSHLSLNATISALPVGGVDQVLSLFQPQYQGLLVNSLSATLNMHLQISSTNNLLTLKGDLDAGNFTAVGDAQINWQTKTGTGNIAIQNLPVELLSVLGQLPLSSIFGTTLNISAHLESGQENRLHLTATSGTFNLPSADFTWGEGIQLSQDAPFSLVSSRGALQGTLKELSLPSFSALEALHASLVVSSPAIDPLTNVHLILSVNTLEHIAFNLQSDTWKGSGEVALRLGTEQIALVQPLQLEYAPVNISLEPFVWDVGKWDRLNIKGALHIPSLVLKDVTLQDTVAPFSLDMKTKTGTFQLTTQLAGAKTGSISAQGTAKNLSADLSSATLDAACVLTNVSSSLVDALTGKTISPLIGPSLNGTLKVSSTPDAQTIALKIASTLVNVDAAMSATTSAVQITQGEMRWTLTPDGYHFLDQLLTDQTSDQAPFDLKEKALFHLKYSNLFLPVLPRAKTGTFTDRFPAFSSDLSSLQLNISGTCPTLAFAERISGEEMRLSNLSLSARKEKGKGGVAFDVSSSVSKAGSLTVKGTLDQLFNDQGKADLAALALTLEGKITQFPSRVCDLFARMKGVTTSPFTKLCGDTMSVTFSTGLKALSGPISATLNSPNTRISIDGKLVNGALTLNQPIYAQSLLTPQASQLFLGQVNPLDISSLYSQAPITLEIPAQDFYFPLYPFQVNRIQIPQGKLELGKIYCNNEGNLKTTLGLLKTKQFEKGREITLWFAPLDFHLSQGSLAIERTEILISHAIDIAVWGNIDLIADYVDMTLGLTAQTLKKAFGIKDLPENYVLTIPMKGPSNDVKINTSKATAKIALLLAWQQKALAGAAAGGPAGALLGGVLGKVAPLPDLNAKVPPAKHPFPWETNKKETSEAPSHSKKKHFKKKERPWKQVVKILR